MVSSAICTPLLTRSDLRDEYVWKAIPGDHRKLIEDDDIHLSRREGDEMLAYLNGLSFEQDMMSVFYGARVDISVEQRLYIEWMLKEHLTLTSPCRGTVTKWANDNWRPLRKVSTKLKPPYN